MRGNVEVDRPTREMFVEYEYQPAVDQQERLSRTLDLILTLILDDLDEDPDRESGPEPTDGVP